MSRITSRRDKGFTLIEILIALALLAIISAVVIPNVVGYMGRGEEQAYKADIKIIQGAVDAYYADPLKRVLTGVNKGKKQYPLQSATEAERISGGTPTGDATAWAANQSKYFIDFDKLKSMAGRTPSANKDELRQTCPSHMEIRFEGI